MVMGTTPYFAVTTHVKPWLAKHSIGTICSGLENSMTPVVVVLRSHVCDWSCCCWTSVPHDGPSMLPLITER